MFERWKGDPELIRSLRADRLTVRQIAAKLGISPSTVSTVARANGISLAKFKITKREKYARARRRYREDREYRERLKARQRDRHDPSKARASVKRWVERHPGASARIGRQYRAFQKAVGYVPYILRGDMVTAAYLPGEWRIVKRYVIENECVCDLDDGRQIVKECPMSGLTLAKP